MSALRLHIEEFDDVDFQLLAIHTSLEDYRLVYFINQITSLKLVKEKSEIAIKNKEGETGFAYFYYEDKNEIKWSLIQNKTEILSLKKQKGQGLFSETESTVFTKIYLLPEYNKVDYFLKIENSNDKKDLSTLISQINSIEKVNTTYSIEYEKIKSKNNLIF